MIVELPVYWRGSAVLQGARTSRMYLFEEVVPFSIADLSGKASEVCRYTAGWEGARGQSISVFHHDGRFMKPVWRSLGRDKLSAMDVVPNFRTGDLSLRWSRLESNYLRDGDKVANPETPFSPDHPVKKWNGDDRTERLAAAARWVAGRCMLIDGIFHEECHEPVLQASPRAPLSDLDVPTEDGARLHVCTDNRIISVNDGYRPRPQTADVFRLDREEAAVAYAATRWNDTREAVSRVPGLVVLRPDLLTWRDEELALASAAAKAFEGLGQSMSIMPRGFVAALLDLRDAGSAAEVEDRFGLVSSALSVFDATDPASLPPVLKTSFSIAMQRLRAGILRHETFVAPTPELPAMAP